MINRQLVHYDTGGQRVIIQPGDLTNVGGDVYAITPSGAVTSVADVPNTIPIRDSDGGFEVGYLQVDTTPPVTETGGVGKLVWNDTLGTLEFQAKGGNVTVQIGQESILRVKNDDTGTLTAGTVVYSSGSDGTNMLVKRASASSEPTSADTIGVATEDIAVHGFVTTFGMVTNINTSALTEGATVWLSTTAGSMTSTRPTAPNHGVALGLCLRKHATNGVVFVSVNNGYELDELHNVLITSVAAGDLLMRNAGNTLWVNQPQSAITIAQSQVTGLTTSLAAKLPLAGGNMTGNLTTSAGVRLGLGTATPQYAIHAQATGEAQLYAGTGFTPALSTSTDPNLLFGYGGAGFRFGGAGTGLSYNQSQIDLGSDQTIRMSTGNGTVAPTERLQVTSTGQVQVLGAGGPAITSANTVVVRAATYPYLHFVNNSSGGAAGDGFLIGIESTYANLYVAEAWDLRFATSATERMRITSGGSVSIGAFAPTAILHLKAGTATASTAPLKLTSGTSLTTAESGAVEYDGTDWYLTDSTPTRRTVDYLPTVTSSTTPVTVPAKGGFVRVVGAAGAKTVNLPALSGVKTGTRVIVKDSSGTAAGGTITITPNGTDTIDGAATATITTNYGVVRLFATGSAGRWEIW